MINFRNLDYVHMSGNEIPFTNKKDISNTIDLISESIKFYDDNFSDFSFEVYLSNGKKLEFKMKKTNLAHLLGLKLNDFYGDYYGKYLEKVLKIDNVSILSSYDILKAVVDNKDNIVSYECGNKFSDIRTPYNFPLRPFNYIKIDYKTELFRDLLKIKDIDFGIIEFKKTKYNKISEFKTNSWSSKLLFIPNKQIISPYTFCGLRTNNEDSYFFETLKLPDNYEDYINSQIVVYPVKMDIFYKNELIETKYATTEMQKDNIKQYYEFITQFRLDDYLNYKSNNEQVQDTLQRYRNKNV